MQLKASDFGLIPDEDADPIFRNSKITRSAWRRKGTSPPFIKIGRQIFYREDHLGEWLKAREAHSTAESKQKIRDLRTGVRNKRDIENNLDGCREISTADDSVKLGPHLSTGESQP